MINRRIFSIKFIGFNVVFILLICVFKELNIFSFPTNQFYFIIVSSLLILFFSLLVILPAIGNKSESFLLQFMILIIFQLLFMLSICAYEVYLWGRIGTNAILFQLVPFAWMLITQTYLLTNIFLKIN